jgi:hypothetical protein
VAYAGFVATLHHCNAKLNRSAAPWNSARVNDKAIEDVTPEPYRALAPRLHFLKAFAQMVVGLVGLVVVLIRITPALFRGHAVDAERQLFHGIGLTLAIATAIELAYTLFTFGPDEAIDPVLLGLSAALLIQLGQVQDFRLQESVSAILYVLALGGLFMIKKRVPEDKRPTDWNPAWWVGLWDGRRWRDRWREYRSRRKHDNGGNKTAAEQHSQPRSSAVTVELPTVATAEQRSAPPV